MKRPRWPLLGAEREFVVNMLQNAYTSRSISVLQTFEVLV